MQTPPSTTDHVFKTHAECEQFIARALGAETLPAGTVSAIAQGVAEVAERSESTGEGVFEMRIGRWVIQNDDIDLMKAFRDALIAMAASGFVLADISAGGGVSIGFAAVTLARNAFRCGATLSANQIKVLTILKREGRAMTTAEIVGALKGPWTADSLKPVLSSLTQVRTRAGLKSFVEEAGPDQWTSSDV